MVNVLTGPWAESAERNFWKHVQKSEGCWLFTGSIDRDGYGVYTLCGGGQQKTVAAHRVAYMLAIGEIPDGLTLDHTCNTPACVRPQHLEPKTMLANIERSRGVAMANKQKTECKNGHPFTPENTITGLSSNGKPKRNCRTCRRDYMREFEKTRVRR